ncbi:flagellar hook-length control protein FliK [Litoreibacter roseus]|uniref:Flagellar hook-length control protein-like C-terminal domain-containing protein n=1 Tax=Litoreibacter roseus TaxID=2601869 RepID=A0A6N6JDI9_9RHOB|nr:flagellar hook-length control protein FliK [Litoreibacter roseus]GFE64423.1 hypothetical protein KIN_14970 [Litoreibacter roseus]
MIQMLLSQLANTGDSMNSVAQAVADVDQEVPAFSLDIVADLFEQVEELPNSSPSTVAATKVEITANPNQLEVNIQGRSSNISRDERSLLSNPLLEEQLDNSIFGSEENEIPLDTDAPPKNSVGIAHNHQVEIADKTITEANPVSEKPDFREIQTTDPVERTAYENPMAHVGSGASPVLHTEATSYGQNQSDTPKPHRTSEPSYDKAEEKEQAVPAAAMRTAPGNDADSIAHARKANSSSQVSTDDLSGSKTAAKVQAQDAPASEDFLKSPERANSGEPRKADPPRVKSTPDSVPVETAPKVVDSKIDLGPKLEIFEQNNSPLQQATTRVATEVGGARTIVTATNTEVAVKTEQVSLQITQAIKTADAREIEVRLDPEELGKVRLVLSQRENGMSVQIIAERPETLDIMRRNASELSADLHQAGFENTEFSFEHRENQNSSEDTTGSSSGQDSATDDSNTVPERSEITTYQITNGLDLKL